MLKSFISKAKACHEDDNVQVSSRDVVAGNDLLLQGNDLVQTAIGVEGRLDVAEVDNGTVGASASVILRSECPTT